MEGESLARRIEEASLRAWPAIEEARLDGWRLRFSQGFTKRANSVQPLGEASAPIAEQVALCEEWYAGRGAPALFRITPFSEPALDRYLGGRAYRLADRSTVMERPAGPTMAAGPDDQLRDADIGEWVSAYGRLSNTEVGPPQALGHILAKIQDRALFGILEEGSSANPVSCGLAVLRGNLLGLFDLVTGPNARRRGHGTALVSRLLEWGAEHGAARAYLQVVQSNVTALQLYEKLGFRSVYEYWYRIPMGADASPAAPIRGPLGEISGTT